MIPISCRLDESFFTQLEKFPVDGVRRARARMHKHKVEMKMEKKDGTDVPVEQVEMVRIDWGMVSVSGHDVTEHAIHMLPITRAVMDDTGAVDLVVQSVEPFIEVQTQIGFGMMVPLFDTGLYRRVVQFKVRVEK
jgi:hypothetical protein